MQSVLLYIGIALYFLKGFYFMALYILDDKKNALFLDSRNLKELSSFTALNQKRIPTKKISCIENIGIMCNDPQAVLLLTGLSEYLLPVLKFCNHNGIPVISIHSSPDAMPDFSYSCIHDNTPYIISSLLTYFELHDKRNVAFFGLSLNNDDCSKAENLYKLCPRFDTDDIFYADRDFKTCFEEFFIHKDKYDAIVCPNDFIAIALIKELASIDPEYLNSVFIVGFMNTYISRLYHTSITSITYNNQDVISAISTIYRAFNHNRNAFFTIDLQLKTILHVRESTHNYNWKPDLPLLPCHKREPLQFKKIQSLPYHDDPHLAPQMSIENMLEKMNKIDFCILYELMLGIKNQDICDRLFISHQTLQYHTSKMLRFLRIPKRNDFINFIKIYIDIDKLKKFIETDYPNSYLSK